jgi:hypothetical protein
VQSLVGFAAVAPGAPFLLKFGGAFQPNCFILAARLTPPIGMVLVRTGAGLGRCALRKRQTRRLRG